jgi:hypothetical protein
MHRRTQQHRRCRGAGDHDNTRRIVAFLFLLFAPDPSSYAQVSKLAQDNDVGRATYARVLLEGNLANGKAFSAFRCRYEIVEGLSGTVEAALARMYKPSHVADVDWVVRDNNQRWSMLADDKTAQQALDAQAAKGAQGKVFGLPSSSHLLGNGREELTYAPILRFANLFMPESPAPPPSLPLAGADAMGLAERNFASGILKLVDEGKATYEGSEKQGGIELHRVHAEYPSRKAIAEAFIDPNRGFLFMRAVDESPRARIEVIIADAKRCDNGAWFPMRVLSCNTQAGRIRVREFRVTEIDTRRPTDDMFRIELPKGTGVADPRDPSTTFTLDTAMTVGLEELPSLFDRAQGAISGNRALGASLQKTPSYWWWLLGGTALFAVCLLGLWRRSRRAPHS